MIDGYSQPGSSPNTLATGNNAVLKVVLNGAGAGAGVNGLTLAATNSTVQGLIINRFDASAISIAANNNVITGNYLGADVDVINPADRGNSTGVLIGNVSGNTIGGATAGARNVIAGNITGIQIEGSNATNNLVAGNYLGTDASGAVDRGNFAFGVFLRAGAHNNTIGGATPLARNVISGNNQHGIFIEGNSSTGNVIQGNYIGTTAAGNTGLGNSGVGPGVLGNDSDADGDALTAVLVSGPTSGALVLNPNGSFTYTPNAGFFGSDSFTYKANDGLADSNVVTVTITVNPGTSVTLQTDPCDPSKLALFVRGTNGNDHIVIRPVGNSGAVEVILNGVSHGPFAPTGRIVVFGKDGDDDIQIVGSISLSAWQTVLGRPSGGRADLCVRADIQSLHGSVRRRPDDLDEFAVPTVEAGERAEAWPASRRL
jgi:hypothetical protein